MGTRLRIYLTREEDRTLFELRSPKGIPQQTKDRARAEALRLPAYQPALL
jgi:hypothetical protein